jgi:exodeoxyribonuclease VII large subunit
VLDHERTNILYRSFQKTEDLALHFLDHERVNIHNKEQLVELLNPEKILKAGYTISTVDEKDVFELQDVVGKEMKTLTSKSLIISKIVKIQNTVKNE